MDRLKILVVDDEQRMRKLVRDFLVKKNFEVLEAGDGEEAVDVFYENKDIALIILDVMMPKMDGWEVCREIRKYSQVPIIMLTAKGEDMDKILGLEYGADDYITKPFNILEVKARIKAILRRTRAAKKNVEENVIVNGDVRIDKDNRRVQICGREINLTGKEFELLEFLVANPGKVYGRAKLLQLIWGKDYPGDERTVDVHVRRLREKIEPNPSEPRYVQTKWGVGYYYQGTSV